MEPPCSTTRTSDWINSGRSKPAGGIVDLCQEINTYRMDLKSHYTHFKTAIVERTERVMVIAGSAAVSCFNLEESISFLDALNWLAVSVLFTSKQAVCIDRWPWRLGGGQRVRGRGGKISQSRLDESEICCSGAANVVYLKYCKSDAFSENQLLLLIFNNRMYLCLVV